MTTVYGSTRLARGYAFDRPPVHERILRLVQPARRVSRALDVGCGAGLSTAALSGLATAVVGLEPATAMLAHRALVAPEAAFVVGGAERLPFADRSFDLVAAAGSLNYVDLQLFLPEASRVLTEGGSLVIYDFSEGRHARGDERLAGWFAEFEQRYPWPPGYRPIDPRALPYEAHGLTLKSCQDVQIAIPLDLEAYLRYVLSEVNVDSAVAAGASEPAARQWCADTLAEIFGDGPVEVLFHGYLADVWRGRRDDG